MTRTIRWLVAVLTTWVLVAPIELAGADDFLAKRQEEEADAEGDMEEEIVEEQLESAEPLKPALLLALHKKMDRSGSGKVSLEDLMTFAREMGKLTANHDMANIMEEIDSSKDGLVQLEEHLEDLLRQLDGDESEEEMEDFELRKVVESKKFKAADTNGDGTLDEAELMGLLFPELNEEVLKVTVDEVMLRKDADKDGLLTLTEFWDNSEEIERSDAEKEEFKSLDADGDGKISPAELQRWESGNFQVEQVMRNLFKVVDKDGDERITAEELASANKELMQSEAHWHLSDWTSANEL